MLHRFLGCRSNYVAVLVLAFGAFISQQGWAQQYPDQDDPRLQAAFPGGDPPGRVGRLSFISNSVSLRAYGDDQWSPATINYPVTTGTAIWTEPNALAEIRIGDAAIRLNNGTELEFVALDDQQVHAFAKQGGVNVQIRSLPPGDRFDISTPRGTVSLSGQGNFRIDAGTETEPTRVAVFGNGTAVVSGDGPSLTVRPGEVALLSGDDNVRYEVRSAELDQFDRWAMARDPIDRPVLSARYVSPEMTGYEDLDQYGTWTDEADYGPVWYPRAVPAAWVPYRFGHWSYVWPWGWTWIDDFPWGFAPFHYGRWVVIRDRWCWHPGHFDRRPVFAPALVAFVGGHGFGVGLGVGPSIGWFPLGPRDHYRPWYRASQRHEQQVNVFRGNDNINNPNFRDHPNRQWATVVDQSDFAHGRPVRNFDQRRRSRDEIAQAPIMDLRPNALPRPERDGRLQRAVGTPRPVNLRAGAVQGFDNRGRDANVDRGRNDGRGNAAGAPSPRAAPFNQDRFERFRDRNPAAFGTPPGLNRPDDAGALPPRQPNIQPRPQNPVDMSPRESRPPENRSFGRPPQQNQVYQSPPSPPQFQRRAEPPQTFTRPENFQRPTTPEVERPRPQPQVQSAPPQVQSAPRQEFRQAPQPQPQPQQQSPRNDNRRRDPRTGI